MAIKDLPKRALTATVFAAVMLGGLLWNVYSFMTLTALLAAGCLWEYYGLVAGIQSYTPGKKLPMRIFYTLVGLVVFTLILLAANHYLGAAYLALVIPLVFVIMGAELYAGATRHFQNAALNVLGIVYLAIPLALLHYLVQEDELQWLPGQIGVVLGMLLLVWTNDTMAYFTGQLMGRNKLFPSISPGKTWEGFIGGVVFSLLVGYLLSRYFTVIELKDWLVIAAIMSVIGTAGDLFESMLKRNLGVKDSGTLMPGHGGFLDRFDAFIFSIPFVFAYLLIVQ